MAPFTDMTAARRAAPSDRARKVYGGLVQAIAEHRLLPGTKLTEDEIGAVYGVSRTITRAALQALAHEGLAVIEKNRGAFVASPSPQDAREVFEMRRLIEPMLAARAAEKVSTQAVQGLRRHAALENEAEEKGDPHAAVRLSGEFHRLIARMAGQNLAEAILSELITRSSLVILLYRRAGTAPCTQDHHAVLIEAIAAGESEKAAHLMRHHLEEIEAELDLDHKAEGPPKLGDILKAAG